jgi:hypothetical protein
VPPKPAKPDLEAIAEPAVPEAAPTPEAQEEATDWDARSKAEQVRRLALENEQIKQDRDERRKYAHRIFCLICFWLSATFILIFLQGFRFYTWFELSDGVLIVNV